MDKTCNKYGFIYITTNTVNGKRYIGKRVYDKRGEWETYLGSGVLLKKAIKKYGRQCFKSEIIDFAASLEELNAKETYWIKHYNAITNDAWKHLTQHEDLSGYRIVYNGTNLKPVNQFDMDMNYLKTYKSARDAERQTGIGYKLISKVCRGERSSTHGFVFQFA